MKLVKTSVDLQELISAYKSNSKSVGFVPTMGALHEGHLSLVKTCKAECDIAVVSIFVNPTQFNNSSDFENYPITIDQDINMLESANCDILFLPSVEEMYPEKDNRVFEFNGLDQVMEGKFRPGHFNGVAQIVSKLFDSVRPSKAYFGQKDFQQLAIIKFMTRQLNFPIEIIPCPIVREKDGLAMSSRNQRLNSIQREKAIALSEALFSIADLKENGASLSNVKEIVEQKFASDNEYTFEYFEVVDSETLKILKDWNDSSDRTACIAVFVGEVRLIDNIRI